MRKSAYDKYCQIQCELSDKFLRYIEGGWCRLPDEDKEKLYHDFNPSNSIFLAANNVYARMDFAKIAIDHVVGHFTQGNGRNLTPYLATLIPRQYVTTLGGGDDIAFSMKTIQAWARYHLRGLDYMGMVEPALFTNWRVGQKHLSMHVHCLIWNIDEAEAKAIENRINSCTNSLVPKIPAADVRPVTKGTEKTTVLYLFKAPTAEYRIYPKKRTVRHPAFGEQKVPTGYWGVHKDVMRPGLYRLVREAMQGWYLDRMMFAGGQGKNIMEEVRKAARIGLSEEEIIGRDDRRPH